MMSEQVIADLFVAFVVWFIYEEEKEKAYELAGFNAWIWRTAGDFGVCDYCAALDGTVWMIGESHPPMPAHIKCRCGKEPINV